MFPAQPHTSRQATVAFLGTCLLLLVTPFERLQPLVSLPGQKLTTVELAIGVALGAWVLSLVWFRERPSLTAPITAPWVLWLSLGVVSALIAPSFRLNALKVVARLTVGLVVVLLPLNGITTSRRLVVAVACASAAAVVVALLAALEFSGVPIVMSWLHAFRENVRVVGGQIRASGTLQYPTITSMYLEIVFALLLGVLLYACDGRSRAGVVLSFLALAVIADGIIVTLTRAGLITMAMSVLVTAMWRYRRVGVDRGIGLLAAVAAVTLVLMVSSASAEALRLRFTTDGRRDWYHATFVAPRTLWMPPGAVSTVDVTVMNNGLKSWDPTANPPFSLSYHWFTDDLTRVVLYDGARTPLPHVVSPGESIQVAMRVRAPGAEGRYELGWDVVQEGRLWFSTEPGSRLSLSTVTIDGEGATGVVLPSPLRALPEQAVYVGRPQLWKAALRMAAAHPLFGVGPDNYRLSYGPYARLEHADPRVTSNNMYLEILTGTGVAGFVAFLWLMLRARGSIGRVRQQLTGAASSLYGGVVAATIAIALHGTLDSFLTLTPTYLAIALTLGLAAAPARWPSAARPPCA